MTGPWRVLRTTRVSSSPPATEITSSLTANASASLRCEVAVRVLRINPLNKEVLDVRAIVRHRPGDGAVVTQDDERHAGCCRTGQLQRRRIDPCQVPHDRRAQAEMGIVGKDRPLGRTAFARHDPLVGRAIRSQLSGSYPEGPPPPARPALSACRRARVAGVTTPFPETGFRVHSGPIPAVVELSGRCGRAASRCGSRTSSCREIRRPQTMLSAGCQGSGR